MKNDPEAFLHSPSRKLKTDGALGAARQLTLASPFGRTRGILKKSDLVSVHLTTANAAEDYYDIHLICVAAPSKLHEWKDTLVVAAARQNAGLDVHVGWLDERGSLILKGLRAQVYKLYINPVSVLSSRPVERRTRLSFDQFSNDREMRATVLMEPNHVRYLAEFKKQPNQNERLVCCKINRSKNDVAVIGETALIHHPDRNSWVGEIQQEHAMAAASDEQIAFFELPNL